MLVGRRILSFFFSPYNHALCLEVKGRENPDTETMTQASIVMGHLNSQSEPLLVCAFVHSFKARGNLFMSTQRKKGSESYAHLRTQSPKEKSLC